ncbi:MAG: pilus assembly protein TadG-related protein [Microcella sp.]|uniref:pilus assembly protein TadG-related protein n=1 Tax=Microcella sp. TaxID=1913979 RepID=UPI003314C336
MRGARRPAIARRWPHALRDDRGSTLPLIIGYAGLALVVVLLVTAATALYLERARLFTLADGAALVGAESFDLDDVTVREGELLRPRLTDARVREDVAAYLAVAPTGSLDGVTLESASTPDGLSARVTLSSYWRPPMLTLFVAEGLRLEVTATARSVFG